jgi:hypothetical protein
LDVLKSEIKRETYSWTNDLRRPPTAKNASASDGIKENRNWEPRFHMQDLNTEIETADRREFPLVIAHKRHAIRREEVGKLDRQTENDKSISPETLFKEEFTINIFGIPLGWHNGFIKLQEIKHEQTLGKSRAKPSQAKICRSYNQDLFKLFFT